MLPCVRKLFFTSRGGSQRLNAGAVRDYRHSIEAGYSVLFRSGSGFDCVLVQVVVASVAANEIKRAAAVADNCFQSRTPRKGNVIHGEEIVRDLVNDLRAV